MTSAQTGKSIDMVRVLVAENGVETATDTAGNYSLDSLAPGTYMVSFFRDGYEPVDRPDVYVAGAGTKRVDVEMTHRIAQLEKMVVRGKAFQKAPDMAASTKIMNADEILRAPGALTDIQRVVQNLPSVASGGDNVNEVVVRGGTPGENLLIMDNIEIPNPNHFAQQGSGGGVVSLINPLLVQGLTFNAGAPPAQYGGKASSAIDVRLRDGNDKIVLGGVDLGLAGAGGHIEGPLWPKATFMASGHRSFLDFISSFQPAVAIPAFWGVQTKLSHHLGGHKLYANGIYGKNSITIKNAREDIGIENDIIESGGTIYVGGMNWDGYWTDRLSTNAVVSVTGNTFDRCAYDPSPGDTGFFNGSREQETTLKASCALDFDNGHRLQIGGYGRQAGFDIDIWEIPDTLKTYAYNSITGAYEFDTVVTSAAGDPVMVSHGAKRHDTGYKYGGYVSGIVHAFDRMRIVPGVRVDVFDYIDAVSVSPRLSAVYSLTNELDLTAAGGIQYQDPEYTDLVKHPDNIALKPRRAVTGIGGAEYEIDKAGAKFIAEGYYKRYDDMAVDSSLLFADMSETGRYYTSDRMYSAGSGHGFGVEFFAQKKLMRHLSGSAAYSFSRSLYEDPRPGHDNEFYDGDFDFRHGLTFTGGWKTELLDRAWYMRLHKKLWFRILSPFMPFADRMEFSAKWRYLGGRPYTRPVYDYAHQRWYTDRLGNLNADRYDPYHRLDLRYERRYGFGFLHMIYYFDFQNIYNRDNVWQYIYAKGRDIPQPVYQFPFFPVGGIIIGF